MLLLFSCKVMSDSFGTPWTVAIYYNVRKTLNLFIWHDNYIKLGTEDNKEIYERLLFYFNLYNISCNSYSFNQLYCCCLVTKSCTTLCNPMDCSTPGFPVLHYVPEFAHFHAIESVMPSNQLILCCPLLLLPSIFPSIKVFSNESSLCIRWLKH